MSLGIVLIEAERRRQIEAEGYTPEHDAGHGGGEFVSAAFAYGQARDVLVRPRQPSRLACNEPPTFPYWPWAKSDFKPARFDHGGAVRDLVKCGALIAAEIDRLVRAAGDAG